MQVNTAYQGPGAWGVIPYVDRNDLHNTAYPGHAVRIAMSYTGRDNRYANMPDLVANTSEVPILKKLHRVTRSPEQRSRLTPWQRWLCASIGIAITTVPLVFLFHEIFFSEDSGPSFRSLPRPEESSVPPGFS